MSAVVNRNISALMAASAVAPAIFVDGHDRPEIPSGTPEVWATRGGPATSAMPVECAAFASIPVRYDRADVPSMLGWVLGQVLGCVLGKIRPALATYRAQVNNRARQVDLRQAAVIHDRTPRPHEAVAFTASREPAELRSSALDTRDTVEPAAASDAMTVHARMEDVPVNSLSRPAEAGAMRADPDGSLTLSLRFTHQRSRRDLRAHRRLTPFASAARRGRHTCQD